MLTAWTRCLKGLVKKTEWAFDSDRTRMSQLLALDGNGLEPLLAPLREAARAAGNEDRANAKHLVSEGRRCCRRAAL